MSRAPASFVSSWFARFWPGEFCLLLVFRIGFHVLKTSTGCSKRAQQIPLLLIRTQIILLRSPRLATRCGGCTFQSIKRTSSLVEAQAFPGGRTRWGQTHLFVLKKSTSTRSNVKRTAESGKGLYRVRLLGAHVLSRCVGCAE